jgi:hypothetical protein
MTSSFQVSRSSPTSRRFFQRQRVRQRIAAFDGVEIRLRGEIARGQFRDAALRVHVHVGTTGQQRRKAGGGGAELQEVAPSDRAFMGRKRFHCAEHWARGGARQTCSGSSDGRLS